jgi:hypothetical protein
MTTQEVLATVFLGVIGAVVLALCTWGMVHAWRKDRDTFYGVLCVVALCLMVGGFIWSVETLSAPEPK